MEYSNSSDINENESRLCSNCQTFFGTKDTNFMCSKCFKENKSEKASDDKESVDVYNQLTQKPGKEALIDVRDQRLASDATMDDENTEKVEEKKLESKPITKPKVSLKTILYGVKPSSSPVSHYILL